MPVRYITPPRPLVPGSKVYTRQIWETKIKNKIKNVTKNKKKKLGLGGAAAGGVPRAADGAGAGRNLVRPWLAARWLQGWLKKVPAALGAAWLDEVDLLALGAAGMDEVAGAGRSGEG